MTTIVTKAIAEIVPAADDAESATGKFDVILSAETEDRDGDTLLRDEWKQPLPDHITFDIDHGMSVGSTVGSGTPRIDDDGTLRVSGTYSSIPRAQEVRTLVNEGHIRTTSVAFMTTKSSKAAGGKTVRELLNGAFVAVPSNREAVVLSSKGYDALESETKAGARNSAEDAAHLQDAHDNLVAAGAVCTTTDGKAIRRPTVKSIVGSVEAKQDRVRDALTDAYPNGYCWLRGVLTDTVIFESSALGARDSYEYVTYSQTYTDDGAVVTLTGTPVEVDIAEIVVPDADADREGVTTLTVNAAPDTKAAAPAGSDPAPVAGSDPADDAADVVDLALRALALKASAAAL